MIVAPAVPVNRLSWFCIMPVGFAWLMLVLVAPRSVLAEERPWFIEIPVSRSGLDFRFENGSRGRFDLPEIMAGGLAAADFDGDGMLDLFLCQGGPIGQPDSRPGGPGGKEGEPFDPPCVWYRNLGSMRFQRVETGSTGPSYAMGAWPADYDADGLVDLFVTGWRGWSLYKNRGGWKFEDRTNALGPNVPPWSTAAVWCDFDQDGHQDLFVGGYLAYDPSNAPYCAAPDGKRDYCGPEDFPPVANRLFAGDGKGGFNDVSAKLGPSRLTGRTLGAMAADFDGDGFDDLFVANDGTACELLIRQPGGEFLDQAIPFGMAFDAAGNAIAAMGVARARSNGQSDLFVTNFFGRGTIQFRKGPGPFFRDISAETGVRSATIRSNGFGIAAADFDGDGVDELVQANGHVLSRDRLGIPFAMPPVLLRRKNGVPRYESAGLKSFPIADRPMLGRGLIVADFDGDSKPDVVIARLDGSPVLLRNVAPNGGEPATRNRQVQGAGGSYLSGFEPVSVKRRSP